jgi:hypothetical protein
MAVDGDPTSNLDDIEVSVCAPTDLTVPDWNRIESILREGKAVNVRSALDEIPIAARLALARHGGAIVGLGAIKRARVWYAEETRKHAKYDFDASMDELGYVAVDAGFQGRRLSSRIVDALLDGYSFSLFATTDTERMKEMLGHRGFKQAGESWKGKRGSLSLWLLERAQPR